MAAFWRSSNNQQAAPEPSRPWYPPVAQPVGSYGADIRNQASGSGQYPRVAQPVSGPTRQPPPIPQPQFQAGGAPGTPGIRVAIQEQYRLTPPLQLPPHTGAVPTSSFHFEFSVEREVLSGAWVLTSASTSESRRPSQREGGIVGASSSMRPAPPPPPQPNLPPPPSSSAQAFPFALSVGSEQEELLEKYRSMGLPEEAVVLGLANYGDETESVKKFCESFEVLRDMGFASQQISVALAMYDNDYNRAVAQLCG